MHITKSTPYFYLVWHCIIYHYHLYISYKLVGNRVEGSFIADYYETKEQRIRIGEVETPVIADIIEEASSGTFDGVIEKFEENQRYCSGFLSMVNMVLVSLQYNTIRHSDVVASNFPLPIMYYRYRYS